MIARLRRNLLRAMVHDRASRATRSPIQHVSRWRSRENYSAAAAHAAGKHVLDVGPGYGVGYEHLLAAEPAGVVCVDTYPDAERDFLHRHDPRVRFEVGDFLASTLPDASFDTVLCLATIYYFRDPRPFFAQVRRVLKPGGVLVINQFESTLLRSWFGCELRDLDPGYGPMHTAGEFADLLRRELGAAPDLFIQSPVRGGSSPALALSTASLPLRLLCTRPRLRPPAEGELGVDNFFVVKRA